jgi:branched-chain amino acid transport system substrate-binding protein
MATRNKPTTPSRGKRFMRVGALTASLVLLAACGSGSGAGGAGGSGGSGAKTIRIGALFPTTGPLALLGEESWRGAAIAAKLRNEAGGINGKKIEYVRADIPNVNAATAEARRLTTKEGVNFAIGSYSSSLALAASEVFARGGGTYVELGAISLAFNDRGYKNVWRTNPPASSHAGEEVSFINDWVAGALKKQPSQLKIVLVHEDSSYGSSVARSVKEQAAKVGIKNISYAPYTATSTDLSSVVLGLRSSKPDVVIAVSYASDAILLARQMKENGVVVPAFIGTGGGHTLAGFGKALGASANNVFDVDFTQYAVKKQATPGLDEFVAAYKKEYGESPASGHSLANFMGAQTVFDILAKTDGDTSAKAFGAAAAKYKVKAGTTPTGWGVDFDAKGQNTAANTYVMQWRNGVLETVWPKSVATMTPVLAK